MPNALILGIKENDTRSISKAITRIENNQRIPDSFYSDLHASSSGSIRIGITGPPGSGKSTLTNELIETCLSKNKTVGVIAVDPTSPFTGGALLGDRVRMNKYLWDKRVFIRSMGSHGDLGGLARKAQEAGDVLAASGKDIILYETNNVMIETISDKSSLMILTDVYYPGWKALIDGVETKVYRADGLVRAVFVPEGNHTVEFVYLPESYSTGIIISVISAIILGGIYLLYKKKINTRKEIKI